MKINRIMIAAPKSGSGKTVITCALLQALISSGKKVISYKCGPDYIDPMFHEKVIGVPAGNLDTFFTDETQTRELFMSRASKNNYAVLEGVMGIFDGLGGVREEGSSYHLAKVTKTPIIFVIDVKGMGRSVIPFIAGFLSYDKEHLIQGVILNRISKEYYETIKLLIEKELKIQVLGFLPDRENFHIESRHLGLILPDELEDIKEKMQHISEEFCKTISIERIMKIAEDAEEIESIEEKNAGVKKQEMRAHKKTMLKDKPIIAVAKDEAFCFYYAENIRMLEEMGADIKYFSPIHDNKLPDGCHALLFGGGYPELYAEKLSMNYMMRETVKKAVENGMPVVAECGGFMYLHSVLKDKEGISYEMAGVIPAVCFYTGKLVRFGYIEIREKQGCFLPESAKIKGHEFHYYDSSLNGDDAVAVKPVTGNEYSCMIEDETRFMGFPHLYYPSNPAYAEQFVKRRKNTEEWSRKKHEKFISLF